MWTHRQTNNRHGKRKAILVPAIRALRELRLVKNIHELPREIYLQDKDSLIQYCTPSKWAGLALPLKCIPHAVFWLIDKLGSCPNKGFHLQECLIPCLPVEILHVVTNLVLHPCGGSAFVGLILQRNRAALTLHELGYLQTVYWLIV